MDFATGLVHFGGPGRDLNPETGTWVKQDPAGFIDGSDRYQFVGGNPAGMVDPSGLFRNSTGLLDAAKDGLEAIGATEEQTYGWGGFGIAAGIGVGLGVFIYESGIGNAIGLDAIGEALVPNNPGYYPPGPTPPEPKYAGPVLPPSCVAMAYAEQYVDAQRLAKDAASASPAAPSYKNNPYNALQDQAFQGMGHGQPASVPATKTPSGPDAKANASTGGGGANQPPPPKGPTTGQPDTRPAAEKPTLTSNPKHNPNSPSPEPSNAQELFDNSIADENGTRWAKDDNGVIHRFSSPSNGQSHWNGSTAGPNPIQERNIPIGIRRALK